MGLPQAMASLWVLLRYPRHEATDIVRLLQLLESRVVVRSTLMRATLHLMTAEDFISLHGTLQPALTGAMQGEENSDSRYFTVRSDAEIAKDRVSRGRRAPRTISQSECGQMDSPF